MSTFFTSWAHHRDTQLCAYYREQLTVKLKDRKLHLSKERHLSTDVPASGCMGDHTFTYCFYFSAHLQRSYLLGYRYEEQTDIETQSPRTLPTTWSSKRPQITGPWELSTVPGEEREGKENNRELA